VLALGPSGDEGAPAAGNAALAEARVQRVDRLGLEPGDRQPPDRRADVFLDLAEVAGPCGPLHLDDIESAVDQLVDRHASARAALESGLLLDLGKQLAA
jgi:hypothetical protein